MNGKELADTISNQYPEIKTLFMSGYTDNIISATGFSEQRINFIQKPFYPEDLIKMIEQLTHSE